MIPVPVRKGETREQVLQRNWVQGGRIAGRDATRGVPPAWYNKPGQLRQEYLVSAALRIASVPAERVAAIRPPVPVNLMPPRFGYTHEAVTIEDVLDTNRWQPTFRAWTSGGGQMLQRSTYQDDAWSGGTRNSMPAMNPLG